MIEQIAVMCRREAKIWQQCADLAQEDQPEEYTASEEVEGMLWTAAADYLETLAPRMERLREAVVAKVALNDSYKPRKLDEALGWRANDELVGKKIEAALAAPTPDEVAEWQEIREKADLLDWCLTRRDGSEFNALNWNCTYSKWNGEGDFIEVLRTANKEADNASK